MPLRPPAPLGAPAPLAPPPPMAPPVGMGTSAIPSAPPPAPAGAKSQRDPFGLGLTIPTPRAPEPTVEAKPAAPPPPSSVMMSPALPEEDILFEDPSVEPAKAATPPPPPPRADSELDFSSLNDEQPRPAAPVQAKPPSKPVPAFEPAHEPEISFDDEEVVTGEAVVETQAPPAQPPPPPAAEAPRPPAPAPAAVAPSTPSAPAVQVRAPVPPSFTPAAGNGAQSEAQLEATLRDALSRASKELIERIAWEVVPQLAEAMIKAELERLMKDRQS